MLRNHFRNCIRWVLRKIRNRGFNQKHILLVGYSRAAEGYIDRIKTNPQWGYHIMGILDDKVAVGTKYRGEQVIGKIKLLQNLLSENELDEIAITLGIAEYSKLEDIVAICENQVCTPSSFRIIIISFRQDRIQRICWDCL